MPIQVRRHSILLRVSQEKFPSIPSGKALDIGWVDENYYYQAYAVELFGVSLVDNREPKLKMLGLVGECL